MDARSDCVLASFVQEHSLNGDRGGDKIERGMKDKGGEDVIKLFHRSHQTSIQIPHQPFEQKRQDSPSLQPY